MKDGFQWAENHTWTMGAAKRAQGCLHQKQEQNGQEKLKYETVHPLEMRKGKLWSVYSKSAYMIMKKHYSGFFCKLFFLAEELMKVNCSLFHSYHCNLIFLSFPSVWDKVFMARAEQWGCAWAISQGWVLGNNFIKCQKSQGCDLLFLFTLSHLHINLICAHQEISKSSIN